jgi:GTPase Era involved in 16S rRNA processing
MPASIQDSLEHNLNKVAAELQQASFPEAMVAAMRSFARQVRESITIAVIGQVKAGKSSLVNALLGCELPTIGVTETTATVNWFRYGSPNDEDHVFCYRGGTKQPSRHPVSFLENLQGDSAAVLKRIANIDRLEFRLPVDWLQNLILVDTPGFNSASKEHQDVAALFAGLASQLRDRNIRETERLAREADAVVYITSANPHAVDRNILEEFQSRVQGSGAFTAIAVVGKLDFHDPDPTMWPRRAASVGKQLQHLVADVVTVSAGIHLIAERFRRNGQALALFRRFINLPSAGEFEILIGSEIRFKSEDAFSLTIPERIAMLGNAPWPAFEIAAKLGRNEFKDAAGDFFSRLDSIAGIDALKESINQNFVSRGSILRCCRIARDAETLVQEQGWSYIRHCEGLDVGERQKCGHFQEFLQRISPAVLPQDRATAAELAQFVSAQLENANRAARARAVVAEISRLLGICRRDVEISLPDLASIRLTNETAAVLPASIAEEFRVLFGCVGQDPQICFSGNEDVSGYITERGRYWRTAYHADNRVQTLYTRAAERYSILLHRLQSSIHPKEKSV